MAAISGVASRTGNSGWFLAGNEEIGILYNPLKGINRALIPSFPTKNQGNLEFVGLGVVEIRVQGAGSRSRGSLFSSVLWLCSIGTRWK